MWLKQDGKWHEFPDGSRKRQEVVNGEPAVRRFGNIRLRVTGFRIGSERLAALSLLTYDDLKFEGGAGWILDGESVNLLIMLVKGPTSAPKLEWNTPTIWSVPMIGNYTADMEKLMPHWRAAKGNTWLDVDTYIVKSVPAMYPTLKLGVNKPELAWPVFPAKPAKGDVIRFQFPVEAGIEADQDWERFYFESTPAKWREFAGVMEALTN